LNSRSDSLEELTLCTYSSGTTMVREVLGDWFSFLGGKPRVVIFSVSYNITLPEVYRQLENEGMIDILIPIQAGARSPQEIDQFGVYKAISKVNTKWACLIKLDVLPFRDGHGDWLETAIERINAGGYFGFGGSYRAEDMQSVGNGFYRTQKYSHNFCIFRPDEWLSAAGRAKQLTLPKLRHGNEPVAADRFLIERTIQDYMKSEDRYVLIRNEDPTWTVFHINQWGEDLRKIRETYLARRGIIPFLNTGKRIPMSAYKYPPWQRYYGYPKPTLLQRLRRKFRKLIHESYFHLF